MWLLPIFSRLSAAALRSFYRLRIAGEPVPASGPVLLLANHPNSLLDPAAVAAVAGRPVRFLAKAPLFSDPQVGWLIRGAGAIPVYRRSDDPALMERNDDTFRAARAALVDGAAVGIFPEGMSHNEPSLAPLKTGAARIALGAAAAVGGPFPVVPVGLSFREKALFRSEALAVIGRPVAWDDLWMQGDEPGAVRELTARIERGLREVTVNLEAWEDAPLIETAEEIYAAEQPLDPSPARRVERLGQFGEALRLLRAGERAEWLAIAEEVRRHADVLERLRLRPHQLGSPAPSAVARWLARQTLLFALLALPAAIGLVAYYPPFRLTGWIEGLARPKQDIRATYKLLLGLVLHLAWTFVLAGVVGWLAGPRAGIAALLALPLAGAAAIYLVERWRRARGEAYRFFVRARRGELVEDLRLRQRELAVEMEKLRTGLHPPFSPRP